jgi:hypothetical protein
MLAYAKENSVQTLLVSLLSGEDADLGVVLTCVSASSIIQYGVSLVQVGC